MMHRVTESFSLRMFTFILSCTIPGIMFFTGGCKDEYSTSGLEEQWVFAVNGLDMWEKPSRQGTHLTTIPMGASVHIKEVQKETHTIQRFTGSWTKVIYQKKIGWVFGGFLTKNKIQGTVLYRFPNIMSGSLYCPEGNTMCPGYKVALLPNVLYSFDEAPFYTDQRFYCIARFCDVQAAHIRCECSSAPISSVRDTFSEEEIQQMEGHSIPQVEVQIQSDGQWIFRGDLFSKGG